MDRQIRELQRRISTGDATAEELDRLLQRGGWQPWDNTHPDGPNPGIYVYLVPTENLYHVAYRDAGGQIYYRMEEEGTIGEHAGEYTLGAAQHHAQTIIENSEPVWAHDDIVCANPHCASVGRAIITQTVPIMSPGEVEDRRLDLRCVECGYEWVDYTA